MKKSVKTALVAVPLTLGALYVGSAWYIGKQVEAQIRESYQLLAGHPFIKVVNRDYQRHLFGASETVTFELFSAVTEGMALKQQELQAANPGVKMPPVPAMRVNFRTEFRHGPWIGGTQLAAAVADSELMLDPAQREAISSVFGNKKPLEIHSVYHFDGSGSSTILSPEFTLRWAAAEGAGQNTLKWDGVRVTVDFEKGMKAYSMHAEAPKLEIRDSRTGSMLMSGLGLDAKQQRMFDDEPLMYAGTSTVSLEQMAFNPGSEGAEAVALKKLTYGVEMPFDGQYLDIIAKIGTETVSVGPQNFGPAHYDFSLRHLHARTLTSLYKTLLKLQTDPAFQASAMANPQAMFAPLVQEATTLLKYNPELSLDRLSFRSPEGEVKLSARVKLKDFKEEDLGNPPVLLTKLDAGAEIVVPEAMLTALAKQPIAHKTPAQTPEAIAEDPAVTQMKMLRKLEALTEQGLIVREGALVKSKITFSEGNLSFNGKPFDPKLLDDPEPPKPEPKPIDHPAMRPAEAAPAKAKRKN